MERVVQDLNEDGFRVVAVGWKEVDGARREFSVADEEGLILIGYLAFLDPPKESAAEALAVMRGHGKAPPAAGVRVIGLFSGVRVVAGMSLPPSPAREKDRHEEGNTAEEIHFLERLDKLSPLNMDRKVDIGTGYIRLGDPEKAKVCFDQAVRIATKDALDAVSRVTQAIATHCMRTGRRMARVIDRRRRWLPGGRRPGFPRNGPLRR